MTQELCRTFSESLSITSKSHDKVMDKALALLSTKDPLAFQAVQAMNDSGVESITQYVDNSELGYYEQYLSENDELSEEEERLLNGIPNI